jgi:hypothetical protein
MIILHHRAFLGTILTQVGTHLAHRSGVSAVHGHHGCGSMTHHGAFNQDSHTVGAVFEIRFIKAGIEAFIAAVLTTVALVDAWLIFRIESHERSPVDVQTFPCSSGIIHNKHLLLLL